MYTDEVEFTPDNAFLVLYLARKYLVLYLVAKVSEYIVSAFKGPSIVRVLPHLHLLDGENAEW